MKPVSSIKTSVRPSRWAFFERGPLVFGPVGNGLFIPLTGALGELLRAPAQTPQEVPNARGTIGNAKMAVNERCNTRQSPECISETMSASTLAQQGDEALALLCMQFGVTAPGMGLGVEASRSMLGHSLPPASNGTGRGLDVSGHLPDTPAGLQQRDGHPASDFELGCRAFGSHRDLIGEIELSL
jgi:hypothetical protein